MSTIVSVAITQFIDQHAHADATSQSNRSITPHTNQTQRRLISQTLRMVRPCSSPAEFPARRSRIHSRENIMRYPLQHSDARAFAPHPSDLDRAPHAPAPQPDIEEV
ncbi:hypothetical protein [Burkholderia ambifaria]|nr:hypothetical protein [Burkholderia ambifaria]